MAYFDRRVAGGEAMQQLVVHYGVKGAACGGGMDGVVENMDEEWEIGRY